MDESVVQKNRSRAGAARGSAREVVSLAYPVVLSHLSASAMHVIDSAMVGQLGATQLAAVGYGGIWIWTALTLFMGTATGVQTFVSQADGAGDPSRCGRWAWQGFYAVVPMTLVGVALFALSFPTLLSHLGPSQELQQHATVYVRWRALGGPGLAALMVLSSFFRGLGDTRTPLVVSVIATLTNVVLDWGLIFGQLGLPAWGVRGAGSATAIAEWLGAILLLLAFWRRGPARYGTQPVAPNRAELRRFLRTSLPIGGQWFIEMSSFALFSTLLARMGDEAMAASQALIALLSLSFMQAMGISIASATLVGRYVGRRDPESAARSHRTAVRLTLVMATGIAVAFISFPATLIRLFSDEASVIRMGLPLIALGGVFQLFDALGIVASGSLRGAGDTRWPFIAQSSLAWGLALPLAYLCGIELGGGLLGAWLALTAYVLVLSAMLLLRFRSGAWRGVRI